MNIYNVVIIHDIIRWLTIHHQGSILVKEEFLAILDLRIILARLMFNPFHLDSIISIVTFSLVHLLFNLIMSTSPKPCTGPCFGAYGVSKKTLRETPTQCPKPCVFVHLSGVSPEEVPIHGMLGPERKVTMGIDISPLPLSRLLYQKRVYSGFLRTSTHGSRHMLLETFATKR